MMEICQKFSKVISVVMSSKFSTELTFENVKGLLPCAAVCCSMLRCVAVCCSVLRCVAVLKWGAVPCALCQRTNTRRRVKGLWLCAAVCCSVLQCVAVYCGMLHCVELW